MTNDNHANYGKIGFFIVLGLSLVIGTLAYLGGAGAGRHELLAETYFQNAVSGLDVGSAVNFRGVRIGSVRRISFVGAEYDEAEGTSISREDARKIYVMLALDTRLFQLGRHSGRTAEESLRRFVERGLHATVSASGVTGLSHIELNFPKMAVEDAHPTWTPRYVCIPPAASLIQNMADSATAILDQINRMNLVAAWSNIVVAIASANELLLSVNTLVDSNQGSVTEILSNLREASSSLREFSDKVKAEPSLLLRSNNPEPLPETK